MPNTLSRPPSFALQARRQPYLEIGDDELDNQNPGQSGFGQQYEAEYYGPHRGAQSRPQPAYRLQGHNQQRPAHGYPRYAESYGAPRQTHGWRTWLALAALGPALGAAFTLDAPTPIINWFIGIAAVMLAVLFAWRKDLLKPRDR